MLTIYQKELAELKIQLEEVRSINEAKSKQLQHQMECQSQKKLQTEQYFKEFQEIIEEYHTELEQKDEEILHLKSSTQTTVSSDADIQLVLERTQHAIEVLQGQLLLEREHKTQLTSQLVELDRMIRQEIQNSKSKRDQEDEERLI